MVFSYLVYDWPRSNVDTFTSVLNFSSLIPKRPNPLARSIPSFWSNPQISASPSHIVSRLMSCITAWKPLFCRLNYNPNPTSETFPTSWPYSIPSSGSSPHTCTSPSRGVSGLWVASLLDTFSSVDLLLMDDEPKSVVEDGEISASDKVVSSFSGEAFWWRGKV